MSCARGGRYSIGRGEQVGKQKNIHRWNSSPLLKVFDLSFELRNEVDAKLVGCRGSGGLDARVDPVLDDRAGVQGV